jgi:hypothetical protein
MGTKILLYKYYIYNGSYELNKFMSLSWLLHKNIKGKIRIYVTILCNINTYFSFDVLCNNQLKNSELLQTMV